MTNKPKNPIIDELEAKLLTSIEGTPLVEALDAFANLMAKYIIAIYPSKEHALDAAQGLTIELQKNINHNYKFKEKILEIMTKRLQ